MSSRQSEIEREKFFPSAFFDRCFSKAFTFRASGPLGRLVRCEVFARIPPARRTFDDPARVFRRFPKRAILRLARILSRTFIAAGTQTRRTVESVRPKWARFPIRVRILKIYVPYPFRIALRSGCFSIGRCLVSRNKFTNRVTPRENRRKKNRKNKTRTQSKFSFFYCACCCSP